MDSETRRLDSGDPARVPGGTGPAAPRPADAAGTPTTYLPPMTPPAANGGPYSPPAGGSSYTVPVAGSTYTAPPPPSTYMPPRNGVPQWRGRPQALIPLLLLVGVVLALSGSFRYTAGAAIPLALGLIFLYVSRQGPGRLGFRIPGCILTGLGAGIVLDASNLFGGGGYSALGLGLGFVALWYMDRAQWWWLIPGAAVGLGGLQAISASTGFGGSILWPLVLIGLSVYLLRGRRWSARP